MSAPSTPSGTTSSTASGTDQLSYSAARQRNTTSTDNAYNSGACAPDRRSSNDRPVHATPNPPGIWLARRSIVAIACPELCPGADAPWISTDGVPLNRSRRGDPNFHLPVANIENGTISPCELRTYHLLRSSGTMRNGASACRYTFLTRPLS